jgi:hypothetical protein
LADAWDVGMPMTRAVGLDADPIQATVGRRIWVTIDVAREIHSAIHVEGGIGNASCPRGSVQADVPGKEKQ